MEDTLNLSLSGLNYFKLSMDIISGLLFAYSMIISVRIIMSWVKLGHTSKLAEILGKVVDPYLNLFRGLPWLRLGALDFSPILGISLVFFVMNITTKLSIQGFITGWGILNLVLSAVWQIAGTILIFLMIIFLIRIITSQIPSIKNHPILTSFDSMIYSISSGILGVFVRKPVSFVTALIISLIVLFSIWLTCFIGMYFLTPILEGLAAYAGTK